MATSPKINKRFASFGRVYEAASVSDMFQQIFGKGWYPHRAKHALRYRHTR